MTIFIIIFIIACYTLATRNAFRNDHQWIQLSKSLAPTGALRNPILLTLERGVFRVKIGVSLLSLATRHPMAIQLTEHGVIIQQHNFLHRNGGEAIELKWDSLLIVKKRYFIRLKILELKHDSIDKVFSIMCVTKKAERTLDEIVRRSINRQGYERS